MFRDERIYRGIVFTSTTLKSSRDVKALLPRNSVVAAEKPRTLPFGSLEHLYYYSETQFTRNIDLLNEAKEKRGGRVMFRYNLYVISTAMKTATYMMIAVPFSRMAKELFSHMRNVMRGQKFQYERVLLDRAIVASRDGLDAAALLAVTRVKYSITADPSMESVFLIGENVAKSQSHDRFVKNIEPGVTVEPESLRVCLDNQFTLTTDNFGHFQFRVSKHAANLAHFPQMLKTLSELKLTEATSAFPHMKHFEDDEMDENE